MTLTKQALVVIALFLAGMAALITIIIGIKPFQAFGSVEEASEYIATSSITAYANTQSVLRTRYNGGERLGSTCTLGSVVVASSSGSTFTLKNASSTTDSASTTIVALKAGIAEGTYTFDVDCTRGLVVQTPTGFNGYYVITFR